MYGKSGYDQDLAHAKMRSELELIAANRSLYGMSRMEKTSARSTAWFVTIVAGLVATFAIGLGIWLLAGRIQMASEGVDTTGTVESCYRMRRGYSVQYSYEVDDKEYTGSTTYYIRLVEGYKIPVHICVCTPRPRWRARMTITWD